MYYEKGTVCRFTEINSPWALLITDEKILDVWRRVRRWDTYLRGVLIDAQERIWVTDSQRPHMDTAKYTYTGVDYDNVRDKIDTGVDANTSAAG